MAVFDGVRCSSSFIPVIPCLRVDETEKIYIPDPNLKSLLGEYDSNRDGEISVIEAEAITRVLCYDSEISDLTGLESCPNLTIINCSGNNISTINIHNLPKLTKLYCDHNNISTLSLCDLPQLTSIDCSNCNISTIDLHNLTNLNTLNCVGNPVKKFVLDNCDALEKLLFLENVYPSGSIQNSIISKTTISFNGYEGVNTFEFRMSSSKFTSFRFKGTFVRSLVLAGDFVRVVMDTNNGLTSTDLSGLPKLEELNIVSSSGLKSLDVTNNTNLKVLKVVGCENISHLDLRNNSNLEELYASGLSISELDLTTITQLKTLDVTDNANLTRVICPSLGWLDSLSRIVNDMLLSYVDLREAVLYGGAATVNVDGLAWASYNVGWSPTNPYGETYTFDDAQKVCPNGWRTPSKAEFESLSKNYSSVVTVNGMQGRWFSGSKTYSESTPAVFLPYQKGSSYGHYWSSPENDSYYADYLYFNSSEVKVYNYRSYPYSVRCLKN